jgi:lipopolysaccharide transport system permease protein
MADVKRHLQVLFLLSRKDFQTRYKRTSLGLAWAVIVPVLQGAVMAVVFSRVVRLGQGPDYGTYVMSGVFAFSYFSQTLSMTVSSIVDGAGLTDKVWFPRVILVVAPALANIVGVVVTFTFLEAILPILGVAYSVRMLLLLPALALLVVFTIALALVVSALHVYYRDVKFLVQASLMVWLYVTPVLYPISLTRHLVPLIIANPLTGVVALVHFATLGTSRGALAIPLAISGAATVLLLAIGLETQRRRDRLFVDLL